MLKLNSLFAATVAMFLFSGTALAADTPAILAAAAVPDGSGGLGILGAGLAVGIAAHGCGMAQGRLAGSALEGMARNPQASGDIRTSMMIALAFPESLVLFCFAIAFLIIS
jgi:F-type H+-transporting ATPase subunit c